MISLRGLIYLFAIAACVSAYPRAQQLPSDVVAEETPLDHTLGNHRASSLSPHLELVAEERKLPSYFGRNRKDATLAQKGPVKLKQSKSKGITHGEMPNPLKPSVWRHNDHSTAKFYPPYVFPYGQTKNKPTMKSKSKKPKKKGGKEELVEVNSQAKGKSSSDKKKAAAAAKKGQHSHGGRGYPAQYQGWPYFQGFGQYPYPYGYSPYGYGYGYGPMGRHHAKSKAKTKKKSKSKSKKKGSKAKAGGAAFPYGYGGWGMPPWVNPWAMWGNPYAAAMYNHGAQRPIKAKPAKKKAPKELLETSTSAAGRARSDVPPTGPQRWGRGYKYHRFGYYGEHPGAGPYGYWHGAGGVAVYGPFGAAYPGYGYNGPIPYYTPMAAFQSSQYEYARALQGLQAATSGAMGTGMMGGADGYYPNAFGYGPMRL